MEKMLADLLMKCVENDLNFEYSSTVDLITVAKYIETSHSYKIKHISKGYIENWKWESPEDALIRIHEEVDKYLDPTAYVEPEETEYARARSTEYERKMKEANVKESDFL